MADIFDSPLSNFAPLLDTETDYDTPFSQIQADKLRIFLEALTTLGYAAGAKGTLTANPPNNTTGYCYDTGAGFTNDEHNGRTIVFTDGNGVGNMYTIDDTEAGNNRVECTGDNLYADGIRNGDAYEIFYDLLNNADGHDHDGINSANVILADDSVDGSAKLIDRSVTASKQDYGVFQNVVQTSGDPAIEHTGDTSYATAIEYYLYLPDEISLVRFFARVKVDGGTGTIRLSISGTEIDNVDFANTSYDWVNISYTDCSAYDESLRTIRLQHKINNATYTVSLQGATIMWA